MKLKTFQFGEIEFEEDKIIDFPKGILGFENLREFLLIKTDNELIFWLNSIEDPDIAFPLVGLKMLASNYPERENYEPFGVATLNSDPLKVTVNLKAPVYISQELKSGFQKIFDNDKYSVQYKLFIKD